LKQEQQINGWKIKEIKYDLWNISFISIQKCLLIYLTYINRKTAIVQYHTHQKNDYDTKAHTQNGNGTNRSRESQGHKHINITITTQLELP
jgi:hypothetical protein